MNFELEHYHATFNHDIMNIYDHNSETNEDILLTSLTFNRILNIEELEKVFHDYVKSIQ